MHIDHAQLYTLVREIDACGIDLTDWEIEFISNLIDKDIHTFTPKQAERIYKIEEDRMG
tara:strand:+ start:2251 stop:2427 length:177 start_codon:yes stop_codon:yes gene_type:complete